MFLNPYFTACLTVSSKRSIGSAIQLSRFTFIRCITKYTKISTMKRRKPGSGQPPASPPLSPEQLARFERNRKVALQRLAARNVPPGFEESWRTALGEEFGKPYFTKLMSFVTEERKRHTVYPPVHQVFSWTQMCPIHDVKVVIFGQDPYHGPGQAHGLSFSVQRPTLPPPSLENVFRELMEDVEGFQHPGHRDLTGWAQQGVLLLNAVLTVRAHQPNSHLDRGWETFTDAVVTWLSANLDGLVFLLWGGLARPPARPGNTALCAQSLYPHSIIPKHIFSFPTLIITLNFSLSLSLCCYITQVPFSRQ